MMTTLLSALFLVGGAGLCLIAAVGVLRFPDFFMRLHAATKAGVAGSGLVLIGVAFAHPSLSVWIKVVLGIAFLLLTTPIAGHLLGRAGYVAGVPLWRRMAGDELEGKLRRGRFDSPGAMLETAQGSVHPRPSGPQGIARIVVALADGPQADAAIAQAVSLARLHGVPLVGLALIDTGMLENVGAVPVGGNYHAARLRDVRLERARRALAEATQHFEQAAGEAGVTFSIRVEEGNPVKMLLRFRGPGDLVLIGREGWFDHGVAGGRHDPLAYLTRRGAWPLVGVSSGPAEISRIVFLHDGTPHSEGTWRWLLSLDPWPDAALRLAPYGTAGEESLADARTLATRRGRAFEDVPAGALTDEMATAQVVIFGNEGHKGWINRAKATSRPPLEGIPIVVFG